MFNKKRQKYFNLALCITVILLLSKRGVAQTQGYLHRTVDKISEVELAISNKTAHYKPIFGEGDEESEMVKGISKYGYLTLDPEGRSELVNYGREELVYYVLEGTGILRYNDRTIPISRDDFFYVPINTDHGFINPRKDTLNIMVMGFPIPEDRKVEPTAELQLASANDVSLQVLGQHGHGQTSRFQLLLGTRDSKRDRLAAAYQVNSLYVIEFDHGGTNIPHRHPREEEIYFVLQGSGEMVAGENQAGKPRRISVKAGDAFFFSNNTLVGFYSGTQQGEERARILAVRSRYPDKE
ncbi:cupin domain-containing protein [Aliifodinibius sp. S!AR15-10]|nr:cupin domain-containing protein [Aliifodinibius sp. S!AR15-10]